MNITPGLFKVNQISKEESNTVEIRSFKVNQISKEVSNTVKVRSWCLIIYKFIWCVNF